MQQLYEGQDVPHKKGDIEGTDFDQAYIGKRPSHLEGEGDSDYIAGEGDQYFDPNALLSEEEFKRQKY